MNKMQSHLTSTHRIAPFLKTRFSHWWVVHSTRPSYSLAQITIPGRQARSLHRHVLLQISRRRSCRGHQVAHCRERNHRFGCGAEHLTNMSAANVLRSIFLQSKHFLLFPLILSLLFTSLSSRAVPFQPFVSLFAPPLISACRPTRVAKRCAHSPHCTRVTCRARQSKAWTTQVTLR